MARRWRKGYISRPELGRRVESREKLNRLERVLRGDSCIQSCEVAHAYKIAKIIGWHKYIIYYTSICELHVAFPPMVDNVVDNDEDARSGVLNPSETLRMAGIGLANLVRNLAYPGQTSVTGRSTERRTRIRAGKGPARNWR